MLSPAASAASSPRSASTLLRGHQHHHAHEDKKSMRRWWPFKSHINKCSSCQQLNQPRCTHPDASQGLEKITEALKTTKGRLDHIAVYLPNCDAEHKQEYIAAQQRLRQRVVELEKLQQTFQNDSSLTFQEFLGWKHQRPRPNLSQYDEFTYIKGGKEITAPLNSRIKNTTGQETLFFISEEDHGDHKHSRFNFDLSQHSDLRVATKTALNESNEGCPCCSTAGTLDLDELAAALPEMSNPNAAHGSSPEIADFNSDMHWGIFLGIAGPLSVLGLTAAYRNIQGSRTNLEKLQAVIQGIDQDIADNKNNHDAQQRLRAFRNTLSYSKGDARFNLWVPGVLNGVASFAVFSTVAFSHPFALPAIALYATAQMGRNAFDLQRSWRPYLAENAGSELTKLGAKKINRVTLSKCRFYGANTAGFSAFAVGAALVFASPFTAGLTLIPGIPLLAAGAVSTGYMNNKWPRKFKPRNAELSLPRSLINTKNAIEEIGKLKQQKSALKSFKESFCGNLPFQSQKAGYGFVASLPYGKSFGTRKQRQMNRDKISHLHQHHADEVKQQRNQTLATLSGIPQKSIENTWDALAKLGIHQAVFSSWLNDGFYRKEPQDHHQKLDDASTSPDSSGHAPLLTPRAGSHSHGDHHEEKEDDHAAHTHHHDHHHHGCGSTCGGHHADIPAAEGISGLEKTDFGFSLNKSDFLEWLKKRENQQALDTFYQAIDHYLMFTWRKQLRYQQYGLIDYFWQLKKLDAKRAVA
jgi:hypothetical protein